MISPEAAAQCHHDLGPRDPTHGVIASRATHRSPVDTVANGCSEAELKLNEPRHPPGSGQHRPHDLHYFG